MRWVVPQGSGLKEQSGEPPDGALGRIAKYIPGEVVSAFTMFAAMVPTMAQDASKRVGVAIVLIIIFLSATVVYVAKNTPAAVRKAHLIVSPLAFLAWAYPISSPMLGEWFVPLVSLIAQAVVMALSIAIQPRVP